MNSHVNAHVAKSLELSSTLNDSIVGQASCRPRHCFPVPNLLPKKVQVKLPLRSDLKMIIFLLFWPSYLTLLTYLDNWSDEPEVVEGFSVVDSMLFKPLTAK